MTIRPQLEICRSDCGYGIRGHPYVDPEEALKLVKSGHCQWCWWMCICRGWTATSFWIGVTQRSRGARHSDDGRLHAGFGAGAIRRGASDFCRSPSTAPVQEIADEVAALYDQRSG